MKNFSIQQIKEIIKQSDRKTFDEICDLLKDDNRKGVQKVITERKNFFKREENEFLRIKNMIDFDRSFRFNYIAGVDEVGRGPLAGPVVAACVVMDLEKPVPGVNDSKKLSALKREELYHQIVKNSLFCAIGEVDNHVIDSKNILNATFMAMNSAISHIAKEMKQNGQKIEFLLVDGNQKISEQIISQKTVVKGDSVSYSIACASILAKVHRDRIMKEMDALYPGYDFSSNMGYGTENHILGIKKLGLSPIHRRSFCSHFIK